MSQSIRIADEPWEIPSERRCREFCAAADRFLKRRGQSVSDNWRKGTFRFGKADPHKASVEDLDAMISSMVEAWDT